VSTATPGDTSGPVTGADLQSTYVPGPVGHTGGTVIIGNWQEANQFNPYYIGSQTEANVASLTWHSLLTIGADFRYVPQLAVAPLPTTDNGGVKVPGDDGDAMTVTWKLRDGLKWSDGAPLTCDDFKYAWEWVLDKDNAGVVTSGFEDIKDFECASDTDMIWHFDKPFEGYLLLLGAPLPRHYLSRIPVKDQVNGVGFGADEITKMPVSGPFKFESVTPQSELRLVRNEHYRNPQTDEPASLDRIVFKWYGDPDAMIAGFRGGEADVMFGLAESDLAKVSDLGDAVHETRSLSYEFLRPNWSPATDFDPATKTGGCSRNAAVQDRGPGCPTSDPAFREAIAYAIDRNSIIQRLVGGHAEVANSGTSPAAWYYAPQPPKDFDPDKARAILEAAGWKDLDGDGYREKDGLKAKIELCTTTRQVRQDVLALISASLKGVGIDSVINAVSSSDIFADYNQASLDTPCSLVTSNFDVALHAFSSSIDPLVDYSTYHSTQFEPHGLNDARVSDPDIDAALDKLKSLVDFSAVRDASAAWQKLYAERTVEIPLYYHETVEVARNVGNLEPNGTNAGTTWNAEDWYLLK